MYLWNADLWKKYEKEMHRNTCINDLIWFDHYKIGAICIDYRFRIDHLGNVLERRARQFQRSVWDLGKHIYFAREARHVILSSFLILYFLFLESLFTCLHSLSCILVIENQLAWEVNFSSPECKNLGWHIKIWMMA